MSNKKSSFHMGNEFNGYGEMTYLKATEHKSYAPLSQKNVRMTPDFSSLLPKMLGIVSVVIDSKSLENNIVVKSLGGTAISNQIILKKEKASGEYIAQVQVANLGLMTGSYLQSRTSGNERINVNPGIQPGWKKQANGGWKYTNESGAYIQSNWKQHKGRWYYLNSDEYMVTDWKKVSGKWYYFKPGQDNGYMVLGWRKIEDKWYYFKEEDEAGYMALGWRKIKDKWYYFKEEDEAGYMVLGWREIKGKWYYFKEEGEAGYMVTGWREINEKWYYFDESGAMVTDKWVDDGKYWVDSNGIWDETKEPESEADEDWMDCVKEIGLWYTKNVTTYLAGPLDINGNATRKYYECKIIGKLVGDDCSSNVSACLVHYGIINSTGYGSYAFNKTNGGDSNLIGALENAGFVWYAYDKNSNFVPQRGDISVQHRPYNGKNTHHVEVIDAYNSATGGITVWSWGSVNPSLPITRNKASWQGRTSGFWRK